MIRTVRGSQREGERERSLRTLKDLEVLEVGVFGVDIEFDARHRNIHYSSLGISLTNGERGKGGWRIGEDSTENGIENLAECGSAKKHTH